MSHSNVSRRHFLKTSAIAGGVAAAGLSVARSAHAQGKEQIKIGMIGCGSRCGGAAFESLSSDPSVTLVAMYDVFEDRLKGKRRILKDEFGDRVQVPDDHCFTDFNGYQKVIDLSDIVLIACASKFHPMYTEAAINSGKHVFVEKPQAIDPPGVRRIEAAAKLAKEKGLSVMSGLQSRWYKPWQETMNRIHDGELGDIVAMQSMFLRAPYVVVPRKQGLSETEYQFSNWYHFAWLSGDDVTQSLVHNVDRMTWALKGEMPKWAFSTAGRSGSFGEQYGDMFDHDSVVYEFESGPRLYAICRTIPNCYNNSSDIIMGSKGVCYLDRSLFVDHKKNVMWQYEGPSPNPYQVEQDELIKAVKTGEPVNCGDFMGKSTMVGILGQIASYQGNAVTWEQAYNSDFQFGPKPEDSSFETPPPSVPGKDGNYPIPTPGVTRYV